MSEGARDMSDKQTTYTFTQEQLEAFIKELIEAIIKRDREDRERERAQANQLKGVKIQEGTRKQDCIDRLFERYHWKRHRCGPLISRETDEAVTLESVYKDLQKFSEIARDTAKKYVNEWREKDLLKELNELRLKTNSEPFVSDLPALWEQIRRLSSD